MKKALVLISIVGLSLSSCSKKDEQEVAAEKAMEQMGQAMQQMEANGTAANKAPGVAIPAKTLVTFLPTISGFELNGEAEYTEMDMQGTKYSQASQRYTSGDKQISVTIFDYNYIAAMTAAFSMFTSMNMETNTEIMRSEKIGGYPGWFTWHKQQNDGTIGVIVADRVYVTLDGNGGVTDAELHSVAESINYSGIAGEVK